ncbi:MAG TPA: S8 family peptidase [Steroidobacteraceae bacterium]|nr:S8 family peptidase [Steroidobacteraceae bacterium]
MSRRFRLPDVWPLLAPALLALAGCGGGGGGGAGGGDPIPPGNPPPTSGVAITGSLLIASVSQADSDVNDPNAPFRANDTRAEAQPIPAPVALGGYVNQPGRGPAGRSFDAGDVDDVFRVELAAGQLIELVLPSADPTLDDTQRDDADLALYDAAGTLIDESLGLGQVERIVAPHSGPHYVRVTAFAGAPLYRLSIGEPTPASSTGADLRLSDDFRAGELVLRLARPDAESAAAASKVHATVATAAAQLETRHRIARKAGAAEREMLVGWSGADGVASSKSTVNATEDAVDGAGFRIPASVQAKHATLLQAKRLRADPLVRSADLNRVLHLAAVPNDPGWRLQRWHYEMIRLPAAWDITRGRADVIVAVVDTGIVGSHPDLAGQLVPGYDFIRDPTNEDGNGIDPDAEDPGCVLDGGSIFHGTHVAGTVAAATDNATGVAGAGWNARVMPLRALDGCEGTGSSYDIAQAVRYAAGLPNDSGSVPTQRADVINLSLGVLAPCDAGSRDLYAEVHGRGVVVVAAAGNEATSTESLPAACPNVLAVSAVDSRGQRSAYTNFGAWVDVAAPGGDMRFDVDGDGQLDGIYSTHATGGGANREPTYRLLQGTSMAAPHVAGVVALMRSVAPALGAAEIEALLRQGSLTRDIGVAGPDELGVGLIDAFATVRTAQGDVTPLPPELIVTPAVLNLGDVGTHADVTVLNGGSGTLAITEVRTSATWLRASASAVDAGGLGRYSIDAERSTLAPGSHAGWVEFVSDAGPKRVTVTLQVTTATLEPDAGLQYVVLLRTDTRATAGPQASVRVLGTSTQYRIEDVGSGTYLVVAGTDMNNDGSICDDGEACGAYPVEPEPTVVEVGTADVSGIDFTTAFRTNVEVDR